MKKLIPADTVDAAGNVWETTGENIRRGAKEFSNDDITALIDVLFPVGSVYCGENSIITSVGTWELIVNYAGKPIFLGQTVLSGGKTTQPALLTHDSETAAYTVLRIFKRVS